MGASMEQAVAIQLLVIQTIASTEEISQNSSDRRERFSGGITNAGSLLGNAKLLIDLRNYNGEFKLLVIPTLLVVGLWSKYDTRNG